MNELIYEASLIIDEIILEESIRDNQLALSILRKEKAMFKTDFFSESDISDYKYSMYMEANNGSFFEKLIKGISDLINTLLDKVKKFFTGDTMNKLGNADMSKISSDPKVQKKLEKLSKKYGDLDLNQVIKNKDVIDAYIKEMGTVLKDIERLKGWDVVTMKGKRTDFYIQSGKLGSRIEDIEKKYATKLDNMTKKAIDTQLKSTVTQYTKKQIDDLELSLKALEENGTFIIENAKKNAERAKDPKAIAMFKDIASGVARVVKVITANIADGIQRGIMTAGIVLTAIGAVKGVKKLHEEGKELKKDIKEKGVKQTTLDRTRDLNPAAKKLMEEKEAEEARLRAETEELERLVAEKKARKAAKAEAEAKK